MKCSKCGTSFGSDMKFCPNCGQPIENSSFNNDSSIGASTIMAQGSTMTPNFQSGVVNNSERVNIGLVILSFLIPIPVSSIVILEYLSSFSNVILNILLGYYYGIAGILLATIISIFIFGFILSANILFKNYFKEISIKEYFLEHMEYAIVTSFNAVICYWLCTRFDKSLFGFIRKGIICILFPNFIYLIMYGKSQLHRECFLWVKNKLWKNNKF